MEVLISVENFEDVTGKYREVNSPRTLEACLRCGLDPTELYARPKGQFKEKGLTPEMLDIKYQAFQTKRTDKISMVKKERQAIIAFAEKKARGLSAGKTGATLSPDKPIDAAEELRQADIRRAAALIELEEKRMEALKRRQEKELNKIVEREQTMAVLQQKISKAEEEEMKKKKMHDKKVAEEKVAEEKRKNQRKAELKRLEQEEAEKKRELAKKEAEVEEKLKKKRLQMEREMLKEARMRDEERKQKVEEARRKTEALLKAQEDLAEENRVKMIEREHRIMQQLIDKKEKKRQEVADQREKAGKRIAEAIEKHHNLHVTKKLEFDERQKSAEERARENFILEQEKLKKQADAREKRNKTRLNRLVDAYRQRKDHREEIIQKREERDSVYATIQADREKKVSMMKFTTDLKLKDKLENVERVARMTEFRRLQILQKIYTEDNKHDDTTKRREDMLRKHSEEAKQSLIRKHEISDTMERMRMTNDFTLLDKLFATKKSKKEKKQGKNEEDEDPRLNQTV